MVPRHGWMLGLGVALAAAPALGQAPPGTSTVTKPATETRPAKRVTIAQATMRPAPALAVAPPSQPGVPHTLAEALAATYSSQPVLLAERAKLRATDESVPAALSGWRPTVVMAGIGGYADGVARAGLGSTNSSKVQTDRLLGTAQATLTQPLYNGGKTQASVNRAKNQVMAERASLINQEQNSFINTVIAYVGPALPVTANQVNQGVIETQQLLALAINNEQVLAKQLQATNDRFRVGEITRTDVAQAEAALAQATAQRQTAEGNLQSARGLFQQQVGFLPPGDLIAPQPLALPVKTERDATAIAANNNPTVVAALFNAAAAKDQIDVAFAQLMPQVSFQGQVFQSNNATLRSTQSNGYQAVVQLSVPIYQGGSEYSAVRQARQSAQQTTQQVDDARRAAVQNAVLWWETLLAAKASANSTREAIRANEIALEGVEREAIVGSRTTLDVLNAQQTLLNSQVQLVQNLAQIVTDSYYVAWAIGRLTAHDLHLPVPLYDETAYYEAVKNKWVGLGDYATDQPGR
ncbi:MAG TPA: TolC family outer membrane protein [Acetobacteraceae bacterium]|nr:TolC family outer membrane protein [Acetobacteraceae bacterium]